MCAVASARRVRGPRAQQLASQPAAVLHPLLPAANHRCLRFLAASGFLPPSFPRPTAADRAPLTRLADFLDLGLAAELGRLFANGSALELGAGKGCYASALRRDQLRRHPATSPAERVRAFDGAPGVANQTGGLVHTADLTTRLTLEPADWILCLEVAEHIPTKHEEVFLSNLRRHNRVGIVLSWSDNPGGNGHVNRRSNAWVIERFGRMGYAHDAPTQRALRRSVSDIHWYRDTIMVFRRQEAAPQRTA